MSKLKQWARTPIWALSHYREEPDTRLHDEPKQPDQALGAAKTRPHARRNNANEASEPGRSTPANASTGSPVTASAEPAAPQTPSNSLNISKPKYDPEHPAAHLREHQFKPGESGNPSGRPKGIFGATALRRLLRTAKDGESKLVALIDAQIDKAIRKRDTRAAEFLRDSVDGKPATGEANYIGSVNVQLNVEMPWAQQPAPVDTVAATQPNEPQESTRSDAVRGQKLD